MKDRWKALLAALPARGPVAGAPLNVVGMMRACIIIAVMAAMVLPLGPTPTAAGQTTSCPGVNINPGADLDAIVNQDPKDRATTFCVHAASSGTTYTVNNTVNLRAGDKLIGDAGATTTRGPATYGTPRVKINDGANNLARIIQVAGPNVSIRWLDISGGTGKYIVPLPSKCPKLSPDGKRCPQNGTGQAIAAGPGGPTLFMEYLRIHHNDAMGIGSMNGKLFRSEFFSNTLNSDWFGYEASAVKGQKEYEAAYNYIHNEQAFGLWCDHGCDNVSSTLANGFWVHHNLLVNNGGWGVRYEFSPIAASGVHLTQPSALIERNEIHGNGNARWSGGSSMEDAQNGTFRLNRFGAATIAGVSYPNNYGKRAILVADSSRTDRTDLWNADVVDNTMGGETITWCDRPDTIVYCVNNR